MPKIHKIQTMTRTFKVKHGVPLWLQMTSNSKKNTRDVIMKATQFPVVSNDATTGFKLQGSSVDKLIVKEWVNKKNWEYVMLSRVRELGGLFLEHPISENPNHYQLKPAYLSMLADFDSVTCPAINMDELQLTDT